MKPEGVSHFQRFQRFELKYPLDSRIADKIVVGLREYMDWDNYCQEDNDYAYLVASLYYDSAGYGCYFQKDDGIENRAKLRLRFYKEKVETDDKVFLEIKRKRDMVVVKDRIEMTKGNCFNLLKDGRVKEILNKYSGKEREVIEEFLWTKTNNCMQPKVVVTYTRKALESSIGLDFRVTFDSDIKAAPAGWVDVVPQARIAGNIVVMEVKFNNIMPAWFHTLVQKYQLSRDSFSKYVYSLDNCRRRLLLWI